MHSCTNDMKNVSLRSLVQMWRLLISDEKYNKANKKEQKSRMQLSVVLMCGNLAYNVHIYWQRVCQ